MIDEEQESIIPESSVSQRVEQSSVISLSESKSEPDSIGDYFIIKDIPERLEEVKRLLSKGPDSVYQLCDLFNLQNASMTWAWNKKGLKEELWLEFYECVHKRKGTVHVVCKYCRHPFTHPNKIGKNPEGTGGPTTSMSRHLKECIPYKKQKSILQSSIKEFTDAANTVDDDILTKALKFFISGNIAFNQADNPYFQELIQTAHGKANQPINRKNIRERLKKLTSTAKEDLMISLMENESKISLALDC